MKKGTLVKMTKHGFDFYHNPVHTFDGSQLRGNIDFKSYEERFCEIFALMGTGKVLIIEPTQVKVKWKFKHKGMYFYSTMWYENKDIRELTLFEKILNFIGVK